MRNTPDNCGNQKAKQKTDNKEEGKKMSGPKAALPSIGRVTHPFAAYDAKGKLRCTVCVAPIKSAAAWAIHLVSKPHKEAVLRLKQKAAAAQCPEGNPPSAVQQQQQQQQQQRPSPTLPPSAPTPSPPPPPPPPRNENRATASVKPVAGSRLVVYGESDDDEGDGVAVTGDDKGNGAMLRTAEARAMADPVCRATANGTSHSSTLLPVARSTQKKRTIEEACGTSEREPGGEERRRDGSNGGKLVKAHEGRGAKSATPISLSEGLPASFFDASVAPMEDDEDEDEDGSDGGEEEDTQVARTAFALKQRGDRQEAALRKNDRVPPSASSPSPSALPVALDMDTEMEAFQRAIADPALVSMELLPEDGLDDYGVNPYLDGEEEIDEEEEVLDDDGDEEVSESRMFASLHQRRDEQEQRKQRALLKRLVTLRARQRDRTSPASAASEEDADDGEERPDEDEEMEAEDEEEEGDENEEEGLELDGESAFFAEMVKESVVSGTTDNHLRELVAATARISPKLPSTGVNCTTANDLGGSDKDDEHDDSASEDSVDEDALWRARSF